MAGYPGWVFTPAAPPATGVEPRLRRHPEPAGLWRQDFATHLAPGWLRLELAYPAEGMVDAMLTLVGPRGERLVQPVSKTGRNRFLALVRPHWPLAAVEIEVSGSRDLATPLGLVLRRVGAGEHRLALLRRGLAVLRGEPRTVLRRAARFLIQMQRQGRTAIPLATHAGSPAEAYRLWRERFDEDDADLAFHRGRLARLAGTPRFLVLLAAEADAEVEAALRRSLEAQVLTSWRLVRPGPEAGSLAQLLAEEPADAVLWPRAGTVLRPHALLVFALALAARPRPALVTADDDDRIGAERQAPRFKPGFSPTRLAHSDYIGDPWCVPADVARQAAAGLPAGAGPADLLRAVAAGLAPADPFHIAQVLSHRLPVRESAPEPRRPAPGPAPSPSPAKPSVTLIIPTRDRADLLRLSVGSILARTDYSDFDIIVVDNGSQEAETQALFAAWAEDRRIRVLRDERPFNYAALNNAAAAEARGALLGLVNNDIEVLDGGWLTALAARAAVPGIGCVGAKLLYPDRRIQHGGVMTGVGGGAAGHRYKRAPESARGDLDALVIVNEVSAVTAACLVVAAPIYRAVGGMDEATFPVGYNDVDFCLKVARAGHRNLFEPAAVLIHHESVSRGRDLSPVAAERFNREVLALRLRWGRRLVEDPYYSPNFTFDAETNAIRVQ